MKPFTFGNFYLPTLPEWRAFFLGAREFRSSLTTAFENDPEGELAEAYDCGRNRTWPERVNRMSFAARWRVTFRAPELEFLAALKNRRVRCEVFAERAGLVGRAVFH